MIERPFSDLLDEFAARTPTPGGGAAAGLAACLGSSLLLMVVRFCRARKANAARDGELAAIEDFLVGVQDRLRPLAERDAAGFAHVADAYKLPRDTPDQQAMRERAVQEGLVGAMVVPEETACAARDVLERIQPVVECAAAGIASDLAAGAELLLAAARIADRNVRANAAFLRDTALADAARGRSAAVLAEVEQACSSLRAVSDRLLA